MPRTPTMLSSRMSRRQHYIADVKYRKIRPFGLVPAHKRGKGAVLCVPELRKRRSERDPQVLKAQQDRYHQNRYPDCTGERRYYSKDNERYGKNKSTG